jgi:hypothetical protein
MENNITTYTITNYAAFAVTSSLLTNLGTGDTSASASYQTASMGTQFSSIGAEVQTAALGL